MCDVRIVQFSCLLNADWFNQNSEALAKKGGSEKKKEKVSSFGEVSLNLQEIWDSALS